MEAISSYMEAMNLHIMGGTSSKGHKLQCENSELFVLFLRCLCANWCNGHYSTCFKDYHNDLNY